MRRYKENKHYVGGYLTRGLRVKRATDVLHFQNASRKRAEILWNTSLTSHYILRLPTIAVIERIVRDTIRRQLARVWESSIIKPMSDPVIAGGFTPQQAVKSFIRHKWLSEKGVEVDEARSWSLRRQQTFLRSNLPTTLEQAAERMNDLWFWGYGRIPAIAPSQNDITDPEEWLEWFFGMFLPDTERVGLVTLVEILLTLKESGFVLPSQRAVTLFSQGIGQFVLNNPRYTAERSSLAGYLGRIRSFHAHLKSILGAGFTFELSRQGFLINKKSDDLALRTHDLFLATTWEKPAEIGWEFCDGFKRPIEFRANGHYGSSRILTEFLSFYASRNDGRRVVEKVDPFLPMVQRWAGDLSALPLWADHLPSFRKTLSGLKYLYHRGRYIGLFLKWVQRVGPVLKDPRNLRRAHIDGDAGRFPSLRAFVDEAIANERERNSLVSAACDFIAHIRGHFGLPSVVEYEDLRRRESRFASKGAKTHRKRIRSHILEEIRRVLLVKVGDTYEWSAWAQQETVLVDGKYVFCPILAAIVFLLLRLPLRGNQVRYLDGGEFDLVRYDVASHTFLANPAGAAERARIRDPRRSMGVFQPAQDVAGLQAAHHLDLQVAINKRRVGERAEYSIPFVDDETHWVICSVMQWQSRFGLPPTLVRENSDPSMWGIAQDGATVEQLPWISCLFRDRTAGSGHPPSASSVSRMWTNLCAEYDMRNERWTNPATGNIGPRQFWPKMAEQWVDSWTLTVLSRRGHVSERHVRKKRFRAIHDIHSLRVAGISYLLDRGLPLEVVASIAGQACLQMTLRYYVLDGAEVRKKLSEVLRENPELQLNAAEVARRLADVKCHSEWLLGTSESAFTALTRAVEEGGIFRIGPTGICPGTSCSDGLQMNTIFRRGPKDRTLVPGSLCGLCVFRIYGPPFLPGLVKEFNETLYALHKVISRQNELRLMCMEAEAEGKFDRATILRNEDEQLTIQSEPDCAHVARLYEMINECLAMDEKSATTADSNRSALSLRTRRSVQPLIEPVGQFEQMAEILRAAELVPATKSIIPDEVADRFQLRLLSLLAKNGVEPFLAGLPDEVNRRGTLAFADLLQKSIPSKKELEDVFSGRALLSQVGFGVRNKIVEGAAALANEFRPESQLLS